MSKLKLSTLANDRPVRVTLDLPAELHRDLVAYAEILSTETGRSSEPVKLIAPMLQRFMATDRAFAKAKRSLTISLRASAPGSDGA